MKTSALLYRPSSQGTTWAGLSCAAAIFAVAICLGRTRIEPSMPRDLLEATTVIDLVDAYPEPVAAATEPEREPPQPETPQDAFAEEPVQPRKAVSKTKPPILRPAPYASNARAGSTSVRASAAVYAPRPDYPYEARRQKATGSGLAVLTIDQSGLVSGVRMERSTGTSVLDASALRAFARWRFKPGTPQRINLPIVFTLVGVSY